MRRLVAALFLLWTLPGYAAGSKIDWQPWSDSVFERAARENRFVLLDLEAVWCHWCHVMDEVTYSDPKVVELIKSRYIPVRVDQDSRPDISRRYENYGWPATVVFNAEGGEIVKRRGYLPPEVMISMLEEIIVDPSPVDYGDDEPVTKFADNPLLSPKLRKSLETAFYDTHDPKLGGLKQFQKFIDHDTVEYGLLRAGQGDKKARGDDASDAHVRAQADRSGVGRHVPVLDRFRLGSCALREDHVHASRADAAVRAGVWAVPR